MLKIITRSFRTAVHIAVIRPATMAIANILWSIAYFAVIGTALGVPVYLTSMLVPESYQPIGYIFACFFALACKELFLQWEPGRKKGVTHDPVRPNTRPFDNN